jgi:tRNA pseudouridine13 synthase
MLRSKHPLENTIGIRYFISNTPGIGGFLKRNFEDFKVKEISNKKNEDENGDYTHFTLEKTNWDTIRAISALSRTLGVSRKRFGFAGTKDKRAVTAQRMGVWNVSPEKLGEVKVKDLRLYDFMRSNEKILVGDLIGNEFEVRVRDPEVKDESVIETGKQEIEDSGVPNYFGYQRFGVIRPNTHIIGKFLLNGDVEGGIMSYLADYYDGEKEDAREARKGLKETGDFKEALKTFPKRLGYERTMIDSLYKNPSDFAGAFRRLHKKLRQLFIHGYQSYLFNLILSRMIENDMDVHNTIIPLFGYQSAFSDGEQGEIEKNVLDEAGIDIGEFKIKSFPELSSRGAFRNATLETKIEYQILEDNSLLFNFSLPKGNYATMVMREFMKADPLNY